MARLLGGFETGQVGVHHRTVAFDGEDQGHVHRNTLGDDGGERCQSGVRGGDNVRHLVHIVRELPETAGQAPRLHVVTRNAQTVNFQVDGQPRDARA